KVVSVSIDNPIQLSPGGRVRLGRMNNLTSVTGLRNIQGATDLSSAFNDDLALTSLDLSGLDTSHVTNMANMFEHARGLTSLDLSHFDTSHVTNMHAMFAGTPGLTSLDVSGWDT
ncbi:BspA family leucine-rich repeat surface protein, partial [Bifidobacterium bombi]